MLSPAALSLGPCAGVAPAPSNHSQRLHLFTRRTHFYFPSNPLQNLHSSSSSKATVSNRSLLCRAPAVAVDSDQAGSSEPAKEEKPKRYFFLVANAKFMLDEEEHFKELLYERLRNFSERQREQDFWLVIEPKFLDKFPEITKRLRRPAVALVSTDGNWITFMKLRLDRVLAAEFDADSPEEALASSPVELQFEKPDKWVAPYRKYEFGWWETFLPQGSSQKKD